MKTMYLIFIFFFLFALPLPATIINIPAYQPTIQAGIDAAVDTVTVLVQPGTYIENINYNGKDITVASLFLTTQDTIYISQTVIDGDSVGTVVTFVSGENQTALLTGFVIKNGNYYGIDCRNNSRPIIEKVTITGCTDYGIYCRDSSPDLKDIVISGNYGGIYCRESSSDFVNITVSGNNGTGISFRDSSPDLENIVISNNGGDGIYLRESSPYLDNIVITNNSGSGIYCRESSPSLVNVWITDNTNGGLICTVNSTPDLSNVSISGNSAEWIGGGIYCENSFLSMENVDIIGNSSGDLGGGIYCYGSELSFSADNRCNIYSNNAGNIRGYGADIFADNCSIIDVIVDTFTVLLPTDYYASPISNFTFDIQHSVIDDLINSDLYVSVDGDNSNIGTSSDSPFQTINHALSRIFSDSMNINTIHLAPGVYSTSTNGEIFPIHWSNYVILSGNNEDETILDADSTSEVMKFFGVTDAVINNITLINSNNNGGILCDNSSPDLQNITISDNNGPGIHCIDNSSPILENVMISDNNGHGIYCDNSDPSLDNVTISNNSGCGICCYYSNPVVQNSIIMGNSAYRGGGIFCDESNPSLINVLVSGNSASTRGGGIYCDESNPVLQNMIITDNYSAEVGGGIYCKRNSSPNLQNVTVSENFALDSGGGIYCNSSSLSFDPVDRSNIFLNLAVSGSDLYANNCSNINVIVDTFTVMQPDEYIAYPIDNFTFDILNAKVEQVDQDLYVSPEGSDDNSGLTVDDPLLTVYYALIKILPTSINPLTIHLSNGIYSFSQTGEKLPLLCRSYVSLVGENETSTIFDGEGLSSILFCMNENNFSLENMTIRNGNTNNWNQGGGIYCSNSDPILQNLIIVNNNARMGGGIYCGNSNPTLQNVTISDNSAGTGGGGYFDDNTSPSMDYVLISGNTADNGGGIYFGDDSSPSIINANIQQVQIGRSAINTTTNVRSCISRYYCVLYDRIRPTEINPTPVYNSTIFSYRCIYNTGA